MMSKKILVVDGDRGIRGLVRINFQRFGYTVYEAADGQTALDLIAVEQPNLVVMEVELPVIGGFELLDRLKSNPDTATAVGTIFLTSRGGDADIIRGYGGGVDCYLTKPFSPRDVLRFAAQILGDPSPVGI